jgi:hypothetical protein
MSVDRHGINHRGELGPLAKCSFEQTDDMLIKAGVFAEQDRVNGVSANIMLGQVAPCGTGDCEVIMDMDKVVRLGAPVLLESAVDERGIVWPAGMARRDMPGPAAHKRQQQQQPRAGTQGSMGAPQSLPPLALEPLSEEGPQNSAAQTRVADEIEFV